MEEDNKRRPEYKNDYGTANDMTDNEKTLSFLNNYFVYKKTHNVDAAAISTSIMMHTNGEHFEEWALAKPVKEAKPAKKAPAMAAPAMAAAAMAPAAEEVVVSKPLSTPAGEQQVAAAPKKLKKKLKLVE